MLRKVLRNQLSPYKKVLLLVVAFQAVQASASSLAWGAAAGPTRRERCSASR